MAPNVDISSMVLGNSKASSMCSLTNSTCKLKLIFPRCFVLATPNSDVPEDDPSVLIPFLARLATYFLILGMFLGILWIILKQFDDCGRGTSTQETTETGSETDPILPLKESPCRYGTTEEDPEASLSCSWEDLYNGMICVICYDGNCECFFTPCGHCVACYSCAQRIMKEPKKLCPICRSCIHKARRLPSP